MSSSGSGTRRHVGRVLVTILSVMVLLTTVVGAGVSVVMGQLQGNITAIDVSENAGPVSAAEPLNIVNDETGTYKPVTIVLMGSDTREGKGNGGFGSASEIGGERSDTTIVMHISGDRKSAIGVSIPRDTTITLPTCKKDGKKVGGYTGRFNQAIELGGPGCTIKAVEEMSGLDINNFMLVDFRGFKRIVDAIGGVEICLKEPVDDPLSGLKLDAGKHVVEGEEALAFVRARKTLGDGSDTSRIRRQQAFISSLMRKVLSSGTLLNPASLLGVLDAATESLTADPADGRHQQPQGPRPQPQGPQAEQRHLHDPPLDAQRRQRHRERQHQEGEADLGRHEERHPMAPEGRSGRGHRPAEDRTREHPRQRPERHSDAGPGQAGRQAAAQAGVHRRGGRQRRDHRLHGDHGAVRPAVGPVGQDPRVRGRRHRHGHVKKLDSVLNLIVGTDFTEVRDVEILDITQDYTAQVNTGDENFCAS